MALLANAIVVVFLGLSLSIFLPTAKATNCIWEQYDFTSLSGLPWIVYTGNGTAGSHYKISVCGPLASPIEAPCKENTAVCRYDSSNSVAEPIGNTTETLNITANGAAGELLLHMQGKSCDQMPGVKYHAIINFKCGKTLGSPVYIESNKCETNFEWHTSVACKAATTAKSEVRCHVYDSDGKKRDLSPLIKQSGGHLVEAATDIGEFYINVCRDISPEETGSTSSCPESAGACGIKDDAITGGGIPSSQLQISTDGKLKLNYTSPDTDCSTIITFICPTRRQSHAPRLTSNLGCKFFVEWVTEYACPEQTLVSHTCTLNMLEHNIEFDLTPLKRAPDSLNRYHTLNGDYDYYINICDEVGVACPNDDHKEGIAGCQQKPTDTSFGKSLGKVDQQTLRYSDNELTLIYQGGDHCSSGFQRTTVINFHCPDNVAEGKVVIGSPEMSSDEGCMYVFNWNTSYACPGNRDLQCMAQDSVNQYDLGPLTRSGEDADNWITASDGDQYFINVCSDLLSRSTTTNCADGAAICLRDSSGAYKSLGRFTSSPLYESGSKSLHLHYTEGDVCDHDQNRKIDSIITLRCRPGHLGSAPSFVRRTHDGCTYEFEWETATACVLKRKTGEDCKVYDDEAGFSFDLSPLTKTGTDNVFYKVSPDTAFTNFEYFINVCEPVVGTACENSSTGVCQADRNHSDTKHFITGLANGNLHYYDGMISLIYEHGEQYHNDAHTPRRTEITFICNASAGDGTPTYKIEQDLTYSFEWHTRLACLEIPVECAVTDPSTGKHYDLSSLTRQTDNWDVEHEGSGTKTKYYMNVCRRVNPIALENGCQPEAAACATLFNNGQEGLKYNSLGQAKSAPTVVDENTLLLHYTDGQTCNENSGAKYNTFIYLHCDPGKLSSEPEYSEMTGCNFTFHWYTAAACPIGGTDVTETGGSCSIQGANTDYVFNLMPLKRKATEPYEVPGQESSTTYKLNICGGVDGCGTLLDKTPGMCNGNSPIAANSSVLEFDENGKVILKYDGGRVNGDLVEVRIKFICSKSVPHGTPVFSEMDGSSYIFEFTTSLVCPPEPVDCHTTDSQGNEYDLSALAKSDGNYVVPDTEHSDLMYYINLCRPIQRSEETAACPGGPIGGCQVSSSGEHKAYNMGYIQSKPVAVAPGEITMRYLGGDVCHKGTDHESLRSTRITLYCSQTQEDPKYEGETPECEYTFSWRTPSACNQVSVVGHDCQVTEPLYHTDFNVNLLHKQGDYNVPGGEFKYLLNVCGPLTTGTEECEGVGVCQTKPGYTRNAGKYNEDLTYHDGVLSLTYKEGHGSCHGKYNRTSRIEFTCDHGNFGGATGPRFINESSSCQYLFEWPTSLACQTFVHGKCTAEKDGNLYDLSHLTLTNDNHEVEGPDHTKYVINVCTSLVHKQGVTCPPRSAACLINPQETDNTKKYQGIGEPSDSQLSFDAQGQVVMTYSSTQNCSMSGHHRKTIITFICAHGKLGTKPEFRNMEDGDCTHRFEWETAEACPVNSDNTEAAGPCKTKNPATGYPFDLTPWKTSEGYHVSDRKGNTFWVNICDDVDNNPCGEGVGSCQVLDGNTDDTRIAGKANDRVFYDDGVLVLNYTDGQLCHHSNTLRNTIINFVCGAPGTEMGTPVFIDESDDCTYYITWSSENVCEEEVLCQVEDDKGHILDLSPLIKADEYHLAVSTLADSNDPGAAFYINVCRPLGAIPNVMCPPGSAACRVKEGEAPKNLGRISQPPTYDAFTKEVTLIYDHGAKSEKAAGKNITTKLILSCVRGPSQGQPELELITDDDQYVFTWPTNAVCPNAEAITTTECHYTDPRTTYKYDLSALRKTSNGDQDYHVPARSGGGTYYVNVCADLTETTAQNAGCGNAAVCLVNTQNQATSYGVTAGQGFQMEGDVLKMSYKEGASCPGSTRKKAAYIRFECNREMQGLGTPTLFSESACDVVFSWATPLACPPIIMDCALAHNGDNYDLRLLSRETSSWEIPDDNGNRYWLNLCQSVHNGPDSTVCSSNAAACRRLSDGSIDMLGTVQTQKMYMADDGETIVLQYSQGSNACARKRRSESKAAVTEIHFKCGKGIGMPKVLPRKGDTDSCLFQFEWITHVACKDVRFDLTVEPVVKSTFIRNSPTSRDPISYTNRWPLRTGLTVSTVDYSRSGVVELESVTMKDHKITDPKSGVSIDLTKLMNEKVPDFPGENSTHFAFSMTGGLPDSDGGENAALCHKSSDSVVVGKADTLKYFMEDDVLELVYESDESCATESGKRTSSLVEVHCNPESSMHFVYRSRSCEYLFDWFTPNVCEKIKGTGSVLPEDSSSPPSRGHTVGVVLGVLFLILVLAVLAIVFHSPERRARFASRMKRVFSRNIVGRSMAYTQLRSDDSNDTLLGGTAVLPTFHDDSDEDLIL